MTIVLGGNPTEDIKDGLLVVFDRDAIDVTKYAYADIKKNQQSYPLPDDLHQRTIVAVYKKIGGYPL